VVTPAELRADLDLLVKTIEESHPNMYAYVSKEEFAEVRRDLCDAIARPMTPLEFYRLVAPAVAHLQNGHTFVLPPIHDFMRYLNAGAKVFPLVCYVHGEDLIVAMNHGPQRVPLGGTVVSINGLDARTLLNRCGRYMPAERRVAFPGLLGRYALLTLWLWVEFGQVDAYTVAIRDLEGRLREHSIPAAPLDENAYKAYLNPPNSFRRDAGVGVIEFNDCGDQRTVRAFLRDCFKRMREGRASHLVIDVRRNPGSDSEGVALLLQHLVAEPFRLFDRAEVRVSRLYVETHYGGRDREAALWSDKLGTIIGGEGPLVKPLEGVDRFEGHVYVLTSPLTLSSAALMPAVLTHLHRARIIGQEPWDTLVLYGDCLPFTLPRTGLQVIVACKRFVVAGGRDNGRGVIPDDVVEQTPNDTAVGRDTVLEFTLGLIHRNLTPTGPAPATTQAVRSHTPCTRGTAGAQ
jgi:hypothetical protein